MWSAAAASNVAEFPLSSPKGLFCKHEDGTIHAWSRNASVSNAAKDYHVVNREGSSTTRHHKCCFSDSRVSALGRIAELFNVNHFVVSQARPFIAPFFQASDMFSYALPRHSTARRRGIFWEPLRRTVILECQHRTRQLDLLGFLPQAIRRFILDETIPGSSLTVTPELAIKDFFSLMSCSSNSDLKEWVLKGERSVWPAVSALKIRCVVELELEAAYQITRRKRPLEGRETGKEESPGRKRKRASRHKSKSTI